MKPRPIPQLEIYASDMLLASAVILGGIYFVIYLACVP